MRFVSLTVSIALAIAPAAIKADGGTVRCSERRGDRLVTVFTSPTPLIAGLVDVSVLLLDANTGTPLTGVPVTVDVASGDSPRRRITREATNETATNKMMRAAEFELPSGKWRLEVFVDDSAKRSPIGFDVDVGEPIAPWVETGFWIGWPFAAVGLFVVHQILARRRSRRPARPLLRDTLPGTAP